MSSAATINLSNPFNAVNASRVIKTLVKKGTTIDTLKTNPNIGLTKKELRGLSPFHEVEHKITDQFVNQVVQLLVSGDERTNRMFKIAQQVDELLGDDYGIYKFS